MRLYLVQHGHAVAKDVDPERPLSRQGRSEVSYVAAFLALSGVRTDTVLHSGKTRADQTAKLFAAAMPGDVTVKQTSGIDPLDPTEESAKTVNGWTEDTMIVGHLPFMARMVSRLTVGDETISTVSFTPGTVVCLDRGEEGDWSIAWMIRPGLVCAAADSRKP